MDDAKLAYLTGFLDAEGTIWRGYVHEGDARRAIRISIVNTNRAVLEAIQSWVRFGAIYERHGEQENHFGMKTIFEWHMYISELVVKLLEQVGPFLRIKREKAEECLEHPVTSRPLTFPYVAGFFDGEGSISILDKQKQKKNRICSAVMTSNYKPVLDEIQALLGYGQIYGRENRSGTAGWQLKVQAHGDQLRFAEAILPFSIVKRERLLEMVQFIKGKDWDMDKWGGHKLAGVTDDELQQLYWGQKVSVRPLAAKYGAKYNSMYQRLKKISAKTGVSMRPLGTNQTLTKLETRR